MQKIPSNPTETFDGAALVDMVHAAMRDIASEQRARDVRQRAAAGRDDQSPTLPPPTGQPVMFRRPATMADQFGRGYGATHDAGAAWRRMRQHPVGG